MIEIHSNHLVGPEMDYKEHVMKIRNARLQYSVVTGIVFGLVVQAVPTWAGDIYRFKGESLQAFFFSTDLSGCIWTDVSVYASEEAAAFHNPPGRPDRSSGSWVSIFISQYHTCDDDFTPLISADCYSYAPLPDADLRITKSLNSATLNTALECFDSVKWTSFDVFVDLTGVGIGNAVRESGHSHYRSPGFNSHSRFSGNLRPAEFSGSVSDGTSNFTPEPSEFSYIMSNSNGTVAIY